MKKYFNFLFTILLIAFVTYRQVPNIINNYKIQGTNIPKTQTIDIASKKTINFPDKNKNIIIFWASWCGPCKVEMYRYNLAIINKEIPKENIFAINLYEDEKTILKFIQNNAYQFIFLKTNQDIMESFNIQVTPTVVHLNNKKIEYITSGISPLGIIKSKWFLDGAP